MILKDIFSSDNNIDFCYVCGESFLKSSDLERCPECRAKLKFNNEDKKELKQTQKKELKIEQKKDSARDYLNQLEILHQEEMNKINNEYNEVFSKLDSYGKISNISLKDLKPKFQLMNKKLYIKNNGKLEPPNCAICLKKIKSGQMINLLACKHIFHKTCSDEWFKNKTECPYCKRYVYFIAK